MNTLSDPKFLKRTLAQFWSLFPTIAKTRLSSIALVGRLRDYLHQARYEPEVVRIIKSVVKAGWVCADIGANVGVVTHVLLNQVGPTGEVIAFEAHPDNAAQLKSASSGWKWGTRVRVENIAVADGSTDYLMLYAGRRRNSSEWNIVGQDVDGNPAIPELEVPACALDVCFPSSERLDFVKVDVEGAEAQVLRGMRRILQVQRPFVLIEFHNDEGWAGRIGLYEAGYSLFDMLGRQLDLPGDHARVYHCLAVPPNANYAPIVAKS